MSDNQVMYENSMHMDPIFKLQQLACNPSC